MKYTTEVTYKVTITHEGDNFLQSILGGILCIKNRMSNPSTFETKSYNATIQNIDIVSFKVNRE